MLFVLPLLSTMAGLRRASHPVPMVIPSQPDAALAMAATLNRQADVHLTEGRAEHADRLSHLALELRCRALRVRA